MNYVQPADSFVQMSLVLV